jgi:hypothetical protein
VDTGAERGRERGRLVLDEVARGHDLDPLDRAGSEDAEVVLRDPPAADHGGAHDVVVHRIPIIVCRR